LKKVQGASLARKNASAGCAGERGGGLEA